MNKIIEKFLEEIQERYKDIPPSVLAMLIVDIEEFLADQDKKHFFELEEVRTKEGGLRISQHKIYDKKLSDQKKKIRKKIEGMRKRLDVYCGCGKLRERQMDGLTFCPKLKKETKTINFDVSHKAFKNHPNNPWGSVEDLIEWEILKDIINKL